MMMMNREECLCGFWYVNERVERYFVERTQQHCCRLVKLSDSIALFQPNFIRQSRQRESMWEGGNELENQSSSTTTALDGF